MNQFDTLTYAKKLRDAGFTEQQAEAQVEALRAVIDENLATKQDIESLRLEIAQLRRDLTGEIEQLRRDLIGEVEQSRRDLTGEIEQLRRDLIGEVEQSRRDLIGEVEQSRRDLRAEIEQLRGEVQRDLKTLELKLTVRMGVMFAAAIAILAVLMRVL